MASRPLNFCPSRLLIRNGHSVLARRLDGASSPHRSTANAVLLLEVAYWLMADKVSVSMPPEVSAAVRTRVGRREFSRYVTAAVRRQLERDQLDALLAEMEAVNGPVSAEILEEVEALWPDAEDEPR